MKNLIKSIGILSLCLVLFSAFTFVKIEKNTPIDSDNIPMGGAYLTFYGKFGGELTKNEISKTTKLQVAGCAEGSKITEFTLIINKSGVLKKYTGNSPELTKEMQSTLKSLGKGHSFEFKNVRARLPEGGMVDVFCKVFTVV